MACMSTDRLGFLLSIMTLEQLKELEIVPVETTERPSHRKLLRMIDHRFNTFRSAHSRLMGSIGDKKMDYKQFEYIALLSERKAADGSPL